jgi:hypothetical protein
METNCRVFVSITAGGNGEHVPYARTFISTAVAHLSRSALSAKRFAGLAIAVLLGLICLLDAPISRLGTVVRMLLISPV